MYIGLPTLLRRLADADLRLHPARRAGRERARPPAQLPHGLHEPAQPLPVLEHELPRRAPHVPAGALPRPAEAARAGQGGHARRPTTACWRPTARSSRPCCARRKTPPTTCSRPLPRPRSGRRRAAGRAGYHRARAGRLVDGWIEVCAERACCKAKT